MRWCGGHQNLFWSLPGWPWIQAVTRQLSSELWIRLSYLSVFFFFSFFLFYFKIFVNATLSMTSFYQNKISVFNPGFNLVMLSVCSVYNLQMQFVEILRN